MVARQTEFTVDDTSRGEYASQLPPIRVSIDTGAAHVQDYLTPEQARELAAELLAAAERNEGDG